MNNLACIRHLIFSLAFLLTVLLSCTAQKMDTTYYKNGQVRSVGLQDLKGKQGIWSFYYPNGQINSKESYLDDRLHGEVIGFNLLGKKISFEQWKNGLPEDSAFYYHETGVLKRKGVYVNGQYAKYWLTYFENGELERKGNYVNGLPDGKWENYNTEGFIVEKGVYEKGKRHGLFQFFDEKGRLQYEGKYEEDKEVGEWYYFSKKGKKKLYKEY